MPDKTKAELKAENSKLRTLCGKQIETIKDLTKDRDIWEREAMSADQRIEDLTRRLHREREKTGDIIVTAQTTIQHIVELMTTARPRIERAEDVFNARLNRQAEVKGPR